MKTPKIEPILGFEGEKLDVDHYLTQDYADVSRASQELPAVIEWINELRQAYAEERDLAKADLELAEAKAYFDLKGTGDGSYQVNYNCKPTEDGLKMAVVLDPKVRELKERVAKMNASAARLSGTMASLQAKVDLIRSSEATRRSTFEETTPLPPRR